MNIKKSERGIYEIVKTEKYIVQEIMEMLRANGAHVDEIVERIPWGRRTSTPGIPDLCGWWPESRYMNFYKPARHFWIEVKKPGGKHRPAQIEWIRQANEDGVLATFAESWKDVVDYFETHGIIMRVK